MRFYFKSERRKPLFFCFIGSYHLSVLLEIIAGETQNSPGQRNVGQANISTKPHAKVVAPLILENFKGRHIRGSVITLVYCPPRSSRIIFDLIYYPPRPSRTIFDLVYYPPRTSRIIFASIYCPPRPSRTIFASVFVYTHCVANKIIVIITLR